MAITGHKGIDVRQTANRLVFTFSLKNSAGAVLATGTTLLRVYELQSDATIKSYDFSDNTFKTTALTSPSLALTHRQGNNNTVDTGLWTAALTTLTGFTKGGIYIETCENSGALPIQQERKWQFGSVESDYVGHDAADGATEFQATDQYLQKVATTGGVVQPKKADGTTNTGYSRTATSDAGADPITDLS